MVDAYDRKLLGERVRLVRKRLGTQKSVAEEVLGISEGHLRELEAGRGGAPSSELLLRIARAGGVSVDWLFGGAEQPAPRLDGELLGRIMQVIGRLYREADIKLDELELGRLAAEEHNVAVGATRDEWPTVLKLVEARTREAIAHDRPARRTRRGA